MLDERRVERMLGELRLDQHFARQFGAAGAAGDLHQLGKQALGCAAVGGEQRGIGTERTDQRQLGEVVPLGQHLRADEDVGLAGVNLLDEDFPLFPALGGIAVDAQDARLRKTFGKNGFDALRAAPERLDVLIAAGRASARHAALEAAVMTTQAPVGEMQNEIGSAARAMRNPAARGAGQHRRIAAPVEEDEALFAALEPLPDGAQQDAR